MKIEIGYFYFIKDKFFDLIDDQEIMKNIIFPDIDSILKKLT